MIVTLDLTRHCIETEIKRRYNQSLSAYFKADAAAAALLEQTIEMLRQALESLDFRRLRTQYPELAGGTRQSITLSMSGDTLVIQTEENRYEKAVSSS